ncbi:BON domain-containing protein [Comamonas sp. NLF-1-9]|uniref:BON domain-containing protein n=1 Tax=Comamonas sp. NLF-1-9 TaxID=2853163 RepID=UPI001C452841|nr:BON domain-containing protein [Comamonas sp. NLF-1-9]QXL84038.1 BON domain-containing protein [Comamonas sp. NLF-1-9]
MKAIRTVLLAAMTSMALVATGCSVIRGQETASDYMDDASITAAVKAKMIEDKTVDAGAFNVQTLNGEVALNGFAKSATERARAGQIASAQKGVRAVHNNLVIRPANK